MGQELNVVAIIQARMGSTRLPGKVLADIAGRPVLWHIVNQLRMARSVDQVVVATSEVAADDAIVDFCTLEGIPWFRGSEEDVLDRYYHVAKRCKADVVVRITADCPLIDPQVVDKVVKTYLNGEYDYVSNTLQYTYPDGLDTEVFSFAALQIAWREAKLQAEREHVTPYMRTSSRFRKCNVQSEVDLSTRNLRWTVDEPEDLEFVRKVYGLLNRNGGVFGLAEVLALLDGNSQLLRLDKGFIRNEGYYKSLAGEKPLAPREQKLERSYALKAKASQLIPSCTQTFSKGPTQFVQGVAPVFLQRGQGSLVWDVDGNQYIDCSMALGSVILGHDYPAVNEAVMRQMNHGVSFSLPHPLEIELAEMLVEIIPCAEMVRLGKNGSDATSGAVRVARAYTERDIIACCGYHGWQDWYIGTTTLNKGVPKALRAMTVPFEYNRIETLERIFDEHQGQVAAVILEPVGVVEPKDGFLQKVRDLTRREGALLVFDETLTGFRLALGGAQEYFDVVPDLGCFGKAIANGYPISTIVGRREIMELFNEVFFSFTFGGETVSLAAAVATIVEMRGKSVIGHLWEQGRKLKDGYNVLAREFGVNHYTECIGLPPRTVIVFRDDIGVESLELKSLFQQECLRRGILFSGAQNICFSHGLAEVDYTLRVYRTAMEILADAIQKRNVKERIEGELVQPIFRRP